MKLLRCTRGGLAVEAALLFPVAILITLGALNGALAMDAHTRLRAAVQAAATEAGRVGTTASAVQAAAQAAPGLELEVTRVEWTPGWVRVEAVTTHKSFGPFGDWPIRAGAAWPVVVWNAPLDGGL